MKLALFICRNCWIVAGTWLALAVGLGALAPRLDPAANERTSFLPSWTPHEQAVAALRRHFPNAAGLSDAAIVFERTGGGKLSAEDFAAIEAAAGAIARPASPAAAATLAGAVVRSPASIPLPASPLKSPDGQAALVIVSVPANFVTLRSSRMVDAIRDVLASAALPAGLAAAVTGSSGFGHDYAKASERSSENTLLVTLIAVIVILLLVYRAPLAALVPLVAISIAAFIAMKILAVAQHFGMHVGTAEKIFVGVLIYGAGTDYSLLFISRCREMLGDESAAAAAATGLHRTAGALIASAGVNIAGMLMLCFADYSIFRTAGPAIAVALAVALAASLTLVPALVSLLGRRMFWPSRTASQFGARHVWPAVARLVTQRPAMVMLLAAVALVLPAANCLRISWVYDTMSELPAAAPGGVGNAAAGVQAVKRHWPVGQIAPVTVLLEANQPITAERWLPAAKAVAASLAAVPGVNDVRSLQDPLGRKADFVSRAVLAAAADRIRPDYLAADGNAMRLQVVLAQPALARESLTAIPHITAAAHAAASAAGVQARVRLAGATAEMEDIRKVTRADFYRVAELVLAVIFLLVFFLLRDPLLAAFMTLATLAGYFATLGLVAALLALAGQGGVDWKVEIFLFVVMVAVGVDYSIFLAARVRQEAAAAPPRQAVANAVIHTGPVISSCGVIMAATLGSLMAGELKLLVQLGAALALGMLIDTFIVRPLLLPAFMALTRRTGRRAAEPQNR